MVLGVRETDDGAKALKKGKHRPRTEDYLKVEIHSNKRGKKILAKNPLDRGHDLIHIETSKKVDDEFWVKITSDDVVDKGGYIEATVLRGRDDIQNKSYFTTDRKSGIEWQGTAQDTTTDTTEKRSEVFTEDDSRGDKNDLLGGHL
ncbi:hypothetical protein [Natronomonas amylolytica]|uniref:hypothetical protein n=1 Tax=Natronomonas amylolytica TaxID=3108498 RepID=UPI003008EF0E